MYDNMITELFVLTVTLTTVNSSEVEIDSIFILHIGCQIWPEILIFYILKNNIPFSFQFPIILVAIYRY